MVSSKLSHSITLLIKTLKKGHQSAYGPLLEVYFERLVQLARKRLQNLPGMAGYDEDVALRSFFSMCRRVQDTERPLELDSRDDLWRMLATRTISRAIDLVRRHKPGEVPGEFEMEQLLTREPTPEEAAEMADECRILLESLDEPELRQIAIWRVEGFTNEEIALKLDCVPRTIERKVGRIRALWKEKMAEGEEP